MKLTVFVFLFGMAVHAGALAQTDVAWKCQTDLREEGGAFESVALRKKGSRHQLVFNYIPSYPMQSSMPAIQDLVLENVMHCRFYNIQEITQCVSTNFKRFVSSERVLNPQTGAQTSQIKVALQSDLLLWPQAYQGTKTDRNEVFIVDLDHPKSFCGFP